MYIKCAEDVANIQILYIHFPSTISWLSIGHQPILIRCQSAAQQIPNDTFHSQLVSSCVCARHVSVCHSMVLARANGWATAVPPTHTCTRVSRYRNTYVSMLAVDLFVCAHIRRQQSICFASKCVQQYSYRCMCVCMYI